MDWTAFAAWLSHRQLCAPATCTQYRRRASQADRWMRLHRNVGLDTADADALTAWVDSLPTTAQSRNHARKALRQAASWMIDVGVRSDDPTGALGRMREPRGLPRPCPAPDRLLAAAEAHSLRASALVHLLLFAGLRFSEARLLTWDRVGDGWVDVLGKGARNRTMPMHPQLAAALDRYRSACTGRWVFGSPRGDRPLAETTIRRWWWRIADAAGVPGTKPHQCRHRFATAVYQSTRDLAVTQDALGHASPVTTRVYMQVESDRVALAVGNVRY